MSAIEIKLAIKMQPPKEVKPTNKAVDLRGKVEQYIYDINSNFTESRQQWHYLKAMYKRLTEARNLNSEARELLKMIAPEVEKHGDGSELNSATIHRHLED